MADEETGTLTERPLGSLLRDLADRAFTGIVHIDGSVRRVICFTDGRLYLALSSPGPSLQRCLIDTGAVDLAGWQAALELASERESLVDSLLEAGTPRDILSEALQELTLSTLLELLVPDRDEFRVSEGETHQLGPSISFAVGAMLEEAGRRLDRWSALKGSLPSTTTRLRRASHLPRGRRSIELDRVQWRIVGALDEPTTLGALIEGIGLGAFGIFEELYHLLDQDVVLVVSDPAVVE